MKTKKGKKEKSVVKSTAQAVRPDRDSWLEIRSFHAKFPASSSLPRDMSYLTRI